MPTPDVHSPSRAHSPATDRRLLIQAEQIRAQYQIMPGAFVGSAFIATLVAVMLRERLNEHVLWSWLSAIYLVTLARFVLWRWFKAANPDVTRISRWGALAIAASALSGIVWGIGGMVLHDRTSFPYQLFVLVCVTGLGFTSSYVTSPLLMAFRAFVVPSFLLSAVPFLLDGSLTHAAIGIAVVLLLPALVGLARKLSQTFLESVQVRLQNSELVEELRRQKQAAEEANIAKSRFLAVASHDLRQPLHALGLFVQALHESSIAAHERQLVANIRRSVDAMEELFEALLDISRLDAGGVRPREQTFGLASVFDRLRLEYGPLARHKGLSLTVMRTTFYVRSDPCLLERIVRNLLSNAIRYTDRGGVVLGCRRRGNDVRIEVWDSGRGIPPERHREVFREFVQLESDREQHKGLGLGLAIVERLARLLGHDITLRSVPGKGSVFCVTLPRGRQEDFIPDPVVEHTTAFDLAGALILVIDADPAACEAMEALLRKWNSDVVAAASLAQMQDRLPALSRVPSLIICDYRPRAPGRFNPPCALSAIEMLRSEFNTEIPAVLLSGDTGTAGAIPEQEAPGLPVLHKPLNPARLRTLIANLLRVHEAEVRPRRAS